MYFVSVSRSIGRWVGRSILIFPTSCHDVGVASNRYTLITQYVFSLNGMERRGNEDTWIYERNQISAWLANGAAADRDTIISAVPLCLWKLVTYWQQNSFSR